MKDLILKTTLNRIITLVFFYFIIFQIFIILGNLSESEIISSGQLTFLFIFLFLTLGLNSKIRGFKILNGIIASINFFYYFYLFSSSLIDQFFVNLDNLVINIYSLFTFVLLIISLITSLYVAYHCLLNSELKNEYLIKDNVKPIYKKLFRYYMYVLLIIIIIITINDISRFL